MADTIIEEIRKTRDEYARRLNYDLHEMCLDLRREQAMSDAPVVSFSTKASPCELVPMIAQADTE